MPARQSRGKSLAERLPVYLYPERSDDFAHAIEVIGPRQFGQQRKLQDSVVLGFEKAVEATDAWITDVIESRRNGTPAPAWPIPEDNISSQRVGYGLYLHPTMIEAHKKVLDYYASIDQRFIDAGYSDRIIGTAHQLFLRVAILDGTRKLEELPVA